MQKSLFKEISFFPHTFHPVPLPLVDNDPYCLWEYPSLCFFVERSRGVHAIVFRLSYTQSAVHHIRLWPLALSSKMQPWLRKSLLYQFSGLPHSFPSCAMYHGLFTSLYARTFRWFPVFCNYHAVANALCSAFSYHWRGVFQINLQVGLLS